MEDFSNAYGFVTHDDVLRAVVLILRNTSSEMMGQDVFIGQLDTYKFMVVVPESQRYAVIGPLHQRLSEAISFFYPNQDWKAGSAAMAPLDPRSNSNWLHDHPANSQRGFD
jgi:GGDEF domain-containing protein